MPRYQLLIRELGKAPRVVPVAQTLVVGRSRRADVVIEDEEVSREQFRIGPADALVFIEGLGQTNRTSVDGTTLEPGQRVTVAAGASIKIGRTVVVLQAADATEGGPARPGNFDATLVAPGPAKGGVPPADLAAQEQTGGFPGPQAAAGAPPAGSAGRATGPGADHGQTLRGQGAFRPGQPSGTTPPSPQTGDVAPDQTIEIKGSFRPGQRTPPPATPTPPPRMETPDVTMQMPGGFRPGRGQGEAPRANEPPAKPMAPRPTASPASEPPARTGTTGSPAPPPRPDEPARPKTVFVPPEAMPAAGSPASTAGGPDVEARLHQAMPRLFVKGDTIRRRVRLMKARTRIGRAETADVLLPNESVSELHAEIEFDGTTWSLRDCGSTNGTLVDGAILRGQAQPIRRHSLLGFGSLRGIFLVNDPASAALERRHEQRALRLLVAAGRLPKDVGKQVAAVAKRDGTQTIAEILLGDTPIEPVDWANAITAVKGRVTLLDRLRSLFTRKPKPPAR